MKAIFVIVGLAAVPSAHAMTIGNGLAVSPVTSPPVADRWVAASRLASSFAEVRAYNLGINAVLLRDPKPQTDQTSFGTLDQIRGALGRAAPGFHGGDQGASSFGRGSGGGDAAGGTAAGAGPGGILPAIAARDDLGLGDPPSDPLEFDGPAVLRDPPAVPTPIGPESPAPIGVTPVPLPEGLPLLALALLLLAGLSRAAASLAKAGSARRPDAHERGGAATAERRFCRRPGPKPL